MVAARQIEPPLLAECERLGAQYSVSGAIHPDDFIFWYVHDHPSFPTKAEAMAYYFSNGRESAQKVQAIVSKHCPVAAPEILEFAAGYGCVTRHWKNELPNARVTACDIHNEALDFIAAQMQVPIARSAHAPDAFKVAQKYDVIFAISFFSHMPKATWQKWLKALAHHLSPGGLLFFTTHGHASLPMANNPKLDSEGFWFMPSSEQKDLSGGEYGSTMTSFDYVYRQIQKTGGLRILRFEEAAWYGHQDLFVLRRP
jgi:SAM-dependent methyltransferase